MAAVRITSFWSAFVSVLLKCVAALGFATPARTKAQAHGLDVVAPATTASAVAPAAARGSAGSGDARGATVARRTGTLLPAPRRERERSLPPTMKQRIRAEAHGASPSARSVLAGDALAASDAQWPDATAAAIDTTAGTDADAALSHRRAPALAAN